MKTYYEKAADKALEAHQNELLDNHPEIHRLSVIRKGEGEEYVVEAGVNDVQAFELNPKNVSYPKKLSISMDDIESLDTDKKAVDVEFTLVTEAPPNTSDIEQEVITLDKAKHRPIQGGDSIGNIKYGNAGTLGSAVTINNKQGYFITNFHVLMGKNAAKGDQVLQPGRLDGGKPGDRVATLFSSTLNSNVDMAIARMDKKTLLRNSIRRVGSISSVKINVPVGTSVKKSGRTTNLTSGKVLSVNTTVRVNGSTYPNGSAVFTKQIMTSKMLEAGDSGSILLTSSNDAIGLCFAGSATRSYANPIQEVISAATSDVSSSISSLNFSS